MNFDDHSQFPDLVHISNNIVFDEERRVMISSTENVLPWSVFLENRHKNWLVCSNFKDDVYVRDYLMKTMFLFNENESKMKLSSIVDHKRESPELLDTAELTYLRIQFI